MTFTCTPWHVCTCTHTHKHITHTHTYKTHIVRTTDLTYHFPSLAWRKDLPSDSDVQTCFGAYNFKHFTLLKNNAYITKEIKSTTEKH